MTAIDTQLGLDKVRLLKKQLVMKLRANREKHHAEYLEAIEGWKKEVIAKMRENLALAEADKSLADWRTEITDEMPQDHSNNYDETIELIEASIDDTLILSRAEFNCYWLDKWAWKHMHESAVTNYSKRAS